MTTQDFIIALFSAVDRAGADRGKIIYPPLNVLPGQCAEVRRVWDGIGLR